jgi:hypothetical protein
MALAVGWNMYAPSTTKAAVLAVRACIVCLQEQEKPDGASRSLWSVAAVLQFHDNGGLPRSGSEVTGHDSAKVLSVELAYARRRTSQDI